MALSYEEFVAATNAELCGDRLIVGTTTDRRFVGDVIDGTFSLNEEGKLLAADIEAAAAEVKEEAVKAVVKKAKNQADAADAEK